MKRKNIDDNDNNFNKNDDKNTIRKKKKVKYNFDITSIVPDKTSLFESAVLDWLKKNLHNSSVNNQKSKSKKYIYDRHQIYKGNDVTIDIAITISIIVTIKYNSYHNSLR